jgi:hypothetical protein
MAARKKATSDRVSSIAGRVQAEWRRLKREFGRDIDRRKHGAGTVLWSDVLALAGSALTQDETPRKVAKRGKR